MKKYSLFLLFFSVIAGAAFVELSAVKEQEKQEQQKPPKTLKQRLILAGKGAGYGGIVLGSLGTIYWSLTNLLELYNLDGPDGVRKSFQAWENPNSPGNLRCLELARSKDIWERATEMPIFSTLIGILIYYNYSKRIPQKSWECFKDAFKKDR